MKKLALILLITLMSLPALAKATVPAADAGGHAATIHATTGAAS
jgi:hypothetical protein